ncbi:hypothetical protein [Streptomyces sp. PSAA01]|uniref:hypothetical protein n=1 Tax=Streptomyces sp. PSAA01 TaxID=2912762 RepID=UPI001F366069|nr:hypothetical protein [Streptomyces sp. PSAA01]MCG0284013.1 hypothetical protein [Streptomyces sp. PSAA01]
MRDHDETGEAEGSNSDGTRRPQTHNDFSGEATAAVQAGSIEELHIHNPPSHQRPSEVPVAITCEVEADYVVQQSWSDAVPLSGGLVRIYVEACEDRAVLLRAMRPIVVARRPPVNGTDTMHWGIPEVRKYAVNLNEDPPRLKGPNFIYTVSPDDPEVFELTVHCGRYDIEWRLELDWTCVGRSGTSLIDLGGYPFRFTASGSKLRRWSRGTRH